MASMRFISLNFNPALRHQILQNNYIQQNIKASFCTISCIRQNCTILSSCDSKRMFSVNQVLNDEIKKKDFLDGKVNFEVEFHSNLSTKWWDRKNPLHAFNEIRVPFIRNGIFTAGYTPLTTDVKRLDGIKILDVGCGGGILSEALARIGANVTGIDLSKELIDVAEAHKKQDDLIQNNLRYLKSSVYDHEISNLEQYNAVVISEVIEHISNKEKFLRSCINMLKTGGCLFITTPNKTKLSYILTIKAAETLRIVPPGTHHYAKFISDEDLKKLLRKLNCAIRSSVGVVYNPLTGRFSMVGFNTLMYAVFAQKASKKHLQIVK